MIIFQNFQDSGWEAPATQLLLQNYLRIPALRAQLARHRLCPAGEMRQHARSRFGIA
jgi:hypothetical protein